MSNAPPPHALNPLNLLEQELQEQLEQQKQELQEEEQQQKQEQDQQQQQQQQQVQQQQFVIPILQPPRPPWQPPPPNLPCLDLIEGSREDYVEFGAPLYEASMKGDWISAQQILYQRPELVRFAITQNCETPLHIAAAAERDKSVEVFVENLIRLMEKKDLELQNRSYNTALSLAASAGNVKIAKIILQKNKSVTEISGSQGMLPLYVAALYARADMVRYLYDISRKMSSDFWTNENRGWVLQKCVEGGIFDVAVTIVNDIPQLTSNNRLLRDVLLILAQKTDAFKEKKPQIILTSIKSIFRMKEARAERECDALRLLKQIWEKISIMPRYEIDNIIRGPPLVTNKTTYPSRVLFVAAKMGNMRFITHLIQSYPDLIWKIDDKGLSIFHIAVKRRQADIYKLLYDIGSMKDLITPIKDKEGNNMLHIVAKRAKEERLQNVSGVALQMQHELLWFREVEQMIPPAYRKRKNKDGDIPYDIFRKSHVNQVKEGAKWVKDTASQCMVVATLIATIVFAAAFTLPGGYNQNTGIPMFQEKAALLVFVIADAISLIFSSSAVLMFLSILTSRYAVNDFLESLLKKLMFGLATLFLSIVTMMIAFTASFFILYNEHLKWVPIMVIGFAAMPVVLFAVLQFHLLGDVFYSTYRSKNLFKIKKFTNYN